jgi:hypothetical protein
MSYEIMSIRTTFHRFVIWNVVLVYEKLSLLKQYSTWYFVPVWTTLHGYSLWNLVFKREIIYRQNFMYDYLSWNFVLSKEIIFKSLRCFIILLNTYYNKVSKWLNANLSTNNGGSGVFYKHLFDYMSEKNDRKNSIFEYYMY